MDIASQMRSVQEHSIQEFGEQLERERAGVVISLAGRRNREKRTFQFLHDADIEIGDTLRSTVSGDVFVILDIDKRVYGTQVVGITAHYETPKQQVQRLAAAQAQQPTISITTGDGSVVNYASYLAHVTQSIGALPNASTADKETLTILMQQLGDALRTVPVEHAEDAETVTERAEAMAKEAKKAKPDQAYLAVSADGLKKAAKNIALVMPAVLDIATQIADRLQAAGHR